ncbi:MAG: HU family DNA-binding protein, partial [Desulfobacterales bacterium]|nr:HU family DNA-binding protein [Desulfobacterales bacterium]
MTLIKADIVKRVRETVRFKNRRKSKQIFLFPEMDCIFLSKNRATDIVNSLFEKIKETLAKGEDVNISRFGKFQTKFRWGRKGR